MAEKRVDVKEFGERNIVWLSEISKKDIPIAGGKGANLAEMYNIGIPVPPAFIVTASAFAKFLKISGIGEKIYEIIHSIDMENTAELEKKSKDIREMVCNARIPDELAKEIEEAYENLNIDKSIIEKASYDAMQILSLSKEPIFVAVRSSATTEDLANASFAGQQETFLNIKGTKNVLDAVKKCWASLFTARAIYYREKNKFEQEKSLIAVVVQKMVNSDKSGVTFTLNPITNNQKEIVVEAVFGLGEGIVSGAIEPDNYTLEKDTYKVISKKIGKKKIIISRNSSGETVKMDAPKEKIDEQVLDWNELEKLVYYAKKLEEHYKWPQDIEWAIEGTNIYIVQTRPVTTIKKEKEEKTISGKVILEGLAASRGIASGVVKIIHNLNDLAKIKPGDILVTKMTNPDMVVTMQKAAAIVTDEGGLTAHAAIVSREVGLPCVVGTRVATTTLKEGQIVTVDGTHGKIYEGRLSEAEQIEKETREEKVWQESGSEKENIVIEIKKESKPVISFISDEIKKAWEELKHVERNVENKIKKHNVTVKVNCDIPDMAEKAAATGADGVGLVRIEFIIAQGGIHPAEYIRRKRADDYTKMLEMGLEKIAKAFQGKPVWVRTSDIRTDEYTSLKGAQQEPKEDNPMLGWHGIRRALDDPEILKAELRAIKHLHDKGFKNVGVMFPFLIYVNELKKAKEFMIEIGLNPEAIDYGVMIETPAAASIIDEFCREGIKFISFGTNDLTQLTLGIDRNNSQIAPLYDEMHPSILKQITHVINVCKSYNVKTSICGQAGSKEEMVRFLISKGIDSISANIDAVEKVREIIEKS